MKRIYCLPLAALFTACSDATAPLSKSAIDAVPSNSFAGATFSFDGSTTAGTGYSLTPATLATSPNGESFLGLFTNEVVTLEVPAGSSSLAVSFNLYIIGSWDGYGGRRYGSDTWSVSAYCAGSATPLYSFTTDFSNKVTTKQHFPNDQNGPLNPGLTEGTADLLGYKGVLSSTHGKGSATDATYSLSLTLETGSCTEPVQVVFRSPSQQLQAVTDEAWGLDNIVVTGT